MPTYDYVCQKCEHEFELFQQMSDPVKRKCPACGEPKLRRQVGSGAGIIFRERDLRFDHLQNCTRNPIPTMKSRSARCFRSCHTGICTVASRIQRVVTY